MACADETSDIMGMARSRARLLLLAREERDPERPALAACGLTDGLPRYVATS